MTWAAKLDSLNESVFAEFAEAATYQAGAAPAVPVRAVLSRFTEPAFAGEQVSLQEEHFTAQIPVNDLAGTPAEGAVLTIGSRSFRLELPGIWDNGIWRLVLKPRPS